jgi:hypothetical protein
MDQDQTDRKYVTVKDDNSVKYFDENLRRLEVVEPDELLRRDGESPRRR